ncbi:hypothetical protein BO83DRAFT_448517 [Aspergillus eucalypticola CBS 122712]|uniref:Uncharacterized protein n=1 Tax=Aspergillus eucalypticola (strain CBS 122712 / IBT 29274) TaxID=1448314 RepID=A0A317V8P8_ASPEC|nr:uncharacterized protein BO83DRAFT_448517 [Aspergillus eucalypticola CBS 122712]PWY69408.1 hypothetical protein BO83DRAFT_448517 [Aspergillus eucalypticola CBS 122712]
MQTRASISMVDSDFFSFADSHILTSTTLPYSVIPVFKILWRIQAMIKSVTARPLDISPAYQREEPPIRLDLMILHDLETVVDNRDGPGTGSNYEEQLAAELSQRLGECISGQNTRSSATGTTEVAPSFFEALRLYAAEYEEPASSEKLSHIHILCKAQDSPARDLERAILQCGKRPRLLNAPMAQCHLNFLHISPNPFVIGHIDEMLDHLKKDKDVAGRVADTYENIVFTGLSDASLAAAQAQDEEAPHSNSSSLEPTPKDSEINISAGLRLKIFDEDTDELLSGASYDFYASQRNAIELENETPPPSSRSGSRQRITRIIYARDDEAEATCVNINGSRFDSELIHVFIVIRDPVRQALSPVPEDNGLHLRPRNQMNSDITVAKGGQ